MVSTGQTIFHYELLSKLGSGGMGVVFRARDLKLDRVVALKFLPPTVSGDETAKARFVQEAKAASAINHPNICSIHDIREMDDGQLFIVMALYDGQSLKHLLTGGLPEQREAVRIIRQVAAGLAAAHEKGIVHRDIKPANIVVTDKGHAVILDFGVAKLTGGSDLTRTGSTVGTVSYMSPEQARGDTLDHRSDIWSLGVVLAESVNGRTPFGGEYEQAILYSILNAEPDLDDEPDKALVNRVIGKALSKDPGGRYATAALLAEDLQAIEAGGEIAAPRRTRKVSGTVVGGIVAVCILLAFLVGVLLMRGGAGSINSLAVLPLANLSGDSDQEYLAAGMTDALINELSKIGAIKVISRQSVMRFKNSDLSLSQIADSLNVDAIVNGSVIRSGESVRVSAQLASAGKEENIWAESFDEAFENVLVLQSQVATRIAEQIQVTLTPGEAVSLSQTRTVNPQAYEAYLRGDLHLYKISRADAETAINYFRQSIALDSTYAKAYAGMAAAWLMLQQVGAVSAAEAGPPVMQSIAKAVRLDSTLAEVHYTQAGIQAWGLWNFDAAKIGFRKAIALKPNYAEAHAYYAHVLDLTRSGGGVESAALAVRLDPYNSLLRSLYAASLTLNRRFEEAIEQANRSLESAPRNVVDFSVLTVANRALGRFDKAFDAQVSLWASRGDSAAVEALQNGYRLDGFPGAAGSLASLLAERSETGFVRAGIIATNYLFAGDNDAALDWLERSYEVRDSTMPYIGVKPEWAPLHGNPRFDALLRKMKLDMWLD